MVTVHPMQRKKASQRSPKAGFNLRRVGTPMASRGRKDGEREPLSSSIPLHTVLIFCSELPVTDTE